MINEALITPGTYVRVPKEVYGHRDPNDELWCVAGYDPNDNTYLVFRNNGNDFYWVRPPDDFTVLRRRPAGAPPVERVGYSKKGFFTFHFHGYTERPLAIPLVAFRSKATGLNIYTARRYTGLIEPAYRRLIAVHRYITTHDDIWVRLKLLGYGD